MKTDLKDIAWDEKTSLYHNLNRDYPQFTVFLDSIIDRASDIQTDSGAQLAFTREGDDNKQYKVIINPYISGVLDSEMPGYLRKRIKRANK